MAPPSFIYVMKDLRKVVPPSREILRGIWLSFYHGAKIGVLGANGAGKSSLLRIMAGVDHDFQGEASLMVCAASQANFLWMNTPSECLGTHSQPVCAKSSAVSHVS